MKLTKELDWACAQTSNVACKKINFGCLWTNTLDKRIRGHDGEKWVTKEETNNPYLKQLLSSLEIWR